MPTIDLGNIKFNWRGTWSASTTYEVDDVVHLDPHSYVCIQRTTGTAPVTGSNNSYWQIMAKGHGNPLTSSDPYETVRINDRFRQYPYDYMTGRGNNNDHTMSRMWDDGKIWLTNGGNTGSHLRNEWNRKRMVETDWSNGNFNRGFRLKVPANTDIVVISVHSGGHQVFSLTDPSTGQGVCKENCDYNSRYYGYAGQETANNTVGAFGGDVTMRYHPIMELPVPNLGHEKEYILVRGRHSPNPHGATALSGWVSGVAFIRNPWGLVTASSMSAYLRLNGGSQVWHSSWEWNTQALAFVHENHTSTIKAPVAAGSGDRVLWFRHHGENHSQAIKFIEVAGKKHQLRPSNGSVPSAILEGVKNQYWGYQECTIKESDIPSSVRANGGCIDVHINNADTNHHWYFGEYGTYFTEPKYVAKDTGSYNGD